MSNVSQRIANLSPEKLALLEQRLIKKGGSATKKQRISKRPASEACPLSFSQQRLWFVNQLDPDSPFNISIAVRLSGILNVEALQQALNAIVARHESLRTTFVSVDESPIQVISEGQSVEIKIIDLSQLHNNNCEDNNSEATIEKILKEEAQYPLNLSSDLMLRATLLRLNSEEHVLLLVMHHAASDGWSVGILFRELAGFYEAFSTGTPSPFPELAIQYADYAYWQRQWLSGEVLQTQLDYWKQQLADSSRVLSLHTDKPRPSVQTFQGGTKYFQFDLDLMQKLKSLSQQSGATVFMTLLAAFATLLYRYSGQEDVVIGSPIANRNRSEVESLIGCFINTLALRTRFQDNPTFLELLEQVREMTLGAYDHQDFPLEKLVEELQPERSLSHAPIFQVMFVLQNAPIGKLELSGLTLTPLEVEDLTAKDDLFLSMMETETGLTGELVYNSSLFEVATIERMVENFYTLLSSIVSNPTHRVAQLPILSATEHHKLFEQWNDTGNSQLAISNSQLFSELFEAQVARTPGAVAVVFEEQQLTYQELNARANIWARYLVEQGVGAETIVALLSERNIDFLTAMLAVFKAGGAYLPLNPEHPLERIQQVLSQSQVPLILTASLWESMLSPMLSSLDSKPQLLCLEKFDSLDYESKNLPVRCKPENLAYVIYTSGSTGEPKGAMLEHRGMLNHLYAKVKDLQLSATDVVAQTAAQTFDISIWQFLVALLVGGRVEIIKSEIATDPTQLLSLVKRQGISILEIVPSLLRMILQQMELKGAIQTELSCLRWLLLTGETLPPNLCRQWFEYYPSIPMMNAYGPTECSDDVTHYPIHQPPTEEILNLPIGRPVSNTQLYVLDSHLQPLPIGVVGELYVGGVGVGRGYLNNAALTSLAFIDNPFINSQFPIPNSQLYKTGDKARYLPDGNIEFLGRIDHQVKIRGFRIELGEIEAVLSKYPQVSSVVVMAREDQPGNQYLAAYIVSTQEIVKSELRDYLKQKLPDYMVPSAIVQIPSIPLTPNGKVDRRALPVPDIGIASAGFVPPCTPTQADLANLWAEILNLKLVGIYDNFFDLGGHSLLATQVISRIRSTLGVELPLRRLFEEPTVAALAESIDKIRSTVQKLQTNSSYQLQEREEIDL
ncbi:MAG: amino acid adenylation domain-containing protein [Scytonematopsis contorta HA4267-MV1]|jgi:amino acid adenylation domain-containing protein|nr:amino acid adenylation domain-containing protein [Scytonematopsis contorta HA4267-MV1]